MAGKASSEVRPRWQELSGVQREALKPLEREWPGIDRERKRKWLVIAGKFNSMSPQEQVRIQARMADWARLSPQERGVARQQFQTAKRVAPTDRNSQWEAYQALAPDEKRQLAARASAVSSGMAERPPNGRPALRGDMAANSQAKTNMVPNPAFAVPPKPVAPMAQQAHPGATTTSIAKRPTPPAHQQTGLPKIAASQGFVDKKTLLPKRGPQGAATLSAADSEPPRSQ